MMKWIDKIPPWLRNRYSLTFIGFLVWMTFADRNDFFTRYSYHQDLKKLEADREYFAGEIEKNRAAAHELRSNPDNLEKFAREKYLMKKDNEEIFLMVEK